MRPLNQKELPLELVKDLGMQYATKKSKEKTRFAIFKCACGADFRSLVKDIKTSKTHRCLKCSRFKITTKAIRSKETGMKICQKCKVDKPLNKFHKNKNTGDGYSYRCKICDSKARKKYYDTSESGRARAYAKNRERYLLNKYGISTEKYNELLKVQHSCCAICEISLKEYQNKDGSKSGKDKRPKMFAVDHDHETNKIRGLLCNECNRGLGLLGDTLNSITKARDYIKGNNVIKG